MSLACPQCRAPAEPYLRAQDLNQRISEQEFEYHRCSACGLIFLSPIPPDLARYYSLDYPPHRIPANREELARAAEAFKWRVDLVRSYSSGGRMLEIGPSYGGFAYLSAQAGFEVDAIEMDRRCCDFINSQLPGVRAINTDNVVEALAGLERRYDVIALWQNIEHLTEPWAVLEALTRKLAPGGFLIIATPNPDSYQFRIYGRYWMHLDAPRHIMLIPPKVLSGFLARRQLHEVALTTTDRDGSAISDAGWKVSREYMLARYQGWARRFLLRLHKASWRVLRLFERWNQKGAGYTAIYQARAS